MPCRVLVALLATVMGAVLWAPVASAAPVSKTLSFPLTGSSTTNVFKLGPYSCCHVAIGDPFNVDLGDIHDVGLSLDMGTTMTSPTHSQLTYTDTNLRQGRTLDLTNTYSRDPGGKLDVNYTLQFTANIYGFAVNPSKSAGDTLSCAVPLLTESCDHTTSVNLFSITVLDVGVGKVDVDFNVPIKTTADTTGDGVTSERTMSVAGAPIRGPGNLTFTSDPAVRDESTFLDCGLPANEPVSYAMDTATSHVNGSVSEEVGLAVSVVGKPIIGPNFTILGPFPIFSVSLPPVSFTTMGLSAAAQKVDLGNLQPNNIPPKITMITSGGTMVEGKDVTWTAATTSPCGASGLHTVWKFSNPNSIEPMVAYGPTAHVVFPDNGVYQGTVTVIDPTGLKTTKDIPPFTITNANPALDPVVDKRVEWGDVVKYHADAFDASGDEGSLAYHWSFGDGSSANGQDVEHVFSAPGTYAGAASATDKDGGSAVAAFSTLVDKRPVTLVYTGAVNALTKTIPTLSATLTDDHNQPVNGGPILFTLGSQSVGAAVDATGHTSTTLLLNQAGDADYGLVAAYGGNALYAASTTVLPPLFHVSKRRTTLTYLGDLDQRPNHMTLLVARLADELNQPVVGVTVTFTLGAQTVAAVTDSDGMARAPLSLNQSPGAYALKAVYAGDANYVASGSGPMTFTIPRNSGVATIAASNLGTAKAGRVASHRITRKARHGLRHRHVIRRGR